jgi:hypothetical protein
MIQKRQKSLRQKSLRQKSLRNSSTNATPLSVTPLNVTPLETTYEERVALGRCRALVKQIDSLLDEIRLYEYEQFEALRS